MPNLRVLENALPFAPLKVCALDSAAKLGKSVDNYLVDFRKSLKTGLKSDPAFEGYADPSFMIDAECPRF